MSLLNSGEQRYIKAINNNYQRRILIFALPKEPNAFGQLLKTFVYGLRNSEPGFVVLVVVVVVCLLACDLKFAEMDLNRWI